MANHLYKQYNQPINDNGLSQIIEQAKQMRRTFNELSQIAQQVVQAMGNKM